MDLVPGLELQACGCEVEQALSLGAVGLRRRHHAAVDGIHCVLRAHITHQTHLRIRQFSFESLDTDNDGRITQAEYKKGVDLLDQNKDGFISQMELPFKLRGCAPNITLTSNFR